MDEHQLQQTASSIRTASTATVTALAALQAVITAVGDPTVTMAALTVKVNELDALIQASSTWIVRANSTR